MAKNKQISSITPEQEKILKIFADYKKLSEPVVPAPPADDEILIVQPEKKGQLKPYSFSKKFSMWTKIKNRFRENRTPAKTVFINMEMANGRHRFFMVKEEKGGFTDGDKNFAFDESLKYYVIELGAFCYDYHENFTLPFRRVFPAKDIRKELIKKHPELPIYSTNPQLLKEFMDSKVIEAVIRGAQLNDLFRMIKILLIIILATSVIGAFIGYLIYQKAKMIGAAPPAA